MLLQNWLQLIQDCADCKKGSPAPPLPLLLIWSHGKLELLKTQGFFIELVFSQISEQIQPSTWPQLHKYKSDSGNTQPKGKKERGKKSFKHRNQIGAI